MVTRCLCWLEGGVMAGSTHLGSSQACFGLVSAALVWIWVSSAIQCWGSLSSCGCTQVLWSQEQWALYPCPPSPIPSVKSPLSFEKLFLWATFVSKPLHLCAETGEMFWFYHRKRWGLCTIAGRRSAGWMSMFILQCLHCFSITEFGAKGILESVIKPYFTIFFYGWMQIFWSP